MGRRAVLVWAVLLVWLLLAVAFAWFVLTVPLPAS